jgi:tRNA(Ile)-lysidine synthase
MPGPVSQQEFSKILSRDFADILSDAGKIAVGVSGGPDSMALAWLLAGWTKKNSGPDIHILCVDHGLRPESAGEAHLVARQADRWPHVQYKTLRWKKAQNPKTRIQEQARKARYALMAEYCRKKKIRHLFLAHHMDDQAETFLFRLAKGSGLDGLAAMKPVQVYEDGMSLLRPLLSVPKQRLLATCRKNRIAYAEDPSNDSVAYARVRMRRAWPAFEAEGLSAKRLAATARRVDRAREALEHMAMALYDDALREKHKDSLVFDSYILLKAPEELVFRALIKAVKTLRPGRSYAPRMEKLEDLLADLRNMETPFRKRTLGGIVFVRDDKRAHIRLVREKL